MDSEEFDDGIQAIAIKLSMGDPFLCEELRSEMHIRILGMETGRHKGYYYSAAKNAAIDYLNSKRLNYSWNNKFKHISLEALRDAGIQIDCDGNIYVPGSLDSSCDLGSEEDI